MLWAGLAFVTFLAANGLAIYGVSKIQGHPRDLTLYASPIISLLTGGVTTYPFGKGRLEEGRNWAHRATARCALIKWRVTTKDEPNRRDRDSDQGAGRQASGSSSSIRT